jgi:aldehyde dehydrogenase (NAD+)
MIEHRKLYINGQWANPASDALLDVISPSTEEVIGRVPVVTPADIDAAVGAARTAFDSGDWSKLDVQERAKYVRAIRDGLIARNEEITDLIAAEAGLPIKAWARVDLALNFVDYYLDYAEGVELSQLRTGVTQKVLVRKEPVGVVAAIVPWNSPLSLAAMKFIPALLAGCTVVLKSDPNTPLHAFALAEVIHAAGLPAGVMNVVPAEREASAALVAHPGVDHVSFTGSTAVGRIVAQTCAQQLKGCTLELGGKSAAIVLDDVDLPAVLPFLSFTTFMNNGEACVLQSRVLAPRRRYDEIVGALTATAAGLAIGDPLATSTDLGPLITAAHRDRVAGFVDRGVRDGAKVAFGGGRPDALTRGWYFEPTVLVDVDNSTEVAQQEIFGPVVSVIPYDDEAQAVALANDTPYGLSGTVWTSDHNRGLDVAAQVRTGNYGINSFGIDACAPFGGWKQSGLGSESGPEGFDEFLRAKSIHLPYDWSGDAR